MKKSNFDLLGGQNIVFNNIVCINNVILCACRESPHLNPQF